MCGMSSMVTTEPTTAIFRMPLPNSVIERSENRRSKPLISEIFSSLGSMRS